MIIGILTLLYLLHGVESASTDGIWLPPLKNLTALNEEHAPTWVAQPPYRETWGIIYNFTITLGLCVYTAIHINIPAPTDSPMKIWFRKLKWMLIALIAPEIVLYTAWAQFYSARSLCKELNEHVKLDDYDLMMGCDIAMGGFVTGQPDTPAQGDNDRNSYQTLDPYDVTYLVNKGEFLRVEQKQIEDKSKADILAKFLVCFQVFWMLVETSARKLSGYPLALQEVHVFVHVVCALAMYTIWFKKPVDIRRAVDVTDQIPKRLWTTVNTSQTRVNNIGLNGEIDITQDRFATALYGSRVLICGTEEFTW
ncbi:hypothetical protein FPQ18DRAFT_423319 [Pyronema domesticum]|nr:hypothetical protein FPQ18DRAFT_423319 [Pyronema domesticum]